MDSWKKFDKAKNNIVAFYQSQEKDTQSERLQKLESFSEDCGGFVQSLFGAIYEKYAMRLMLDGKSAVRLSDWDRYDEGHLDRNIFEHTRTFRSMDDIAFITAFPYMDDDDIIKYISELKENYNNPKLIASHLGDKYNFLWQDVYINPFVMCMDDDRLKSLKIYDYLQDNRII